MSEIFQNTKLNYGGGYKSNVGIIQSVGGKLRGILMQNLAWTYAQEMQRLFELGPAGGGSTFLPLVGDVPNNSGPSFYYLSGRASGQLQIGHVLGPRLQLASYYKDFSDVCRAGDNMVTVALANSSCDNNSRQAILMYAVLVQVGQSAQVPSLQINEGSSMMFGNCDYSES